MWPRMPVGRGILGSNKSALIRLIRPICVLSDSIRRAADHDAIVAEAAGAIVVTHLDIVGARGRQIRHNAGIAVLAAVVIFSQQGCLAVGAIE